MLGLDLPAACVGWRSDLCPLWACQGVHRGQWQHAGVSVRVCKVAQASRPAYASTGFWPLGEDRLWWQRCLPASVLAEVTLEGVLLGKQEWPFSVSSVTLGVPDVSQSHGWANTSW